MINAFDANYFGSIESSQSLKDFRLNNGKWAQKIMALFDDIIFRDWLRCLVKDWLKIEVKYLKFDSSHVAVVVPKYTVEGIDWVLDNFHK